MRRLGLLLTALFLTSVASAPAQWGEAPVAELGDRGVATCLRDAGGGRVASADRAITLHAVSLDGLRPDGAVRFAGRLDGCPAVAAAESGAAVVAAVTRTARRHELGPPRLVVAAREPGGGFGTPVELAGGGAPPRLLAPSVAVGADGSAAVAWLDVPNGITPAGTVMRLRIARRSPGGTFGPPETLIRRARSDFNFTEPVLGFDAAGALTVAWARPRSARSGFERSDVEAVTAAPGATFGTPQKIAAGVNEAGVLSLAVSPGGGALLAFDADSGVRVHERLPGATAFGTESVLAGEYGRAAPAVGLADDGGAVVAWRRLGVVVLPPAGGATIAQDATDGVVAVTRPPGGTFGPEQRLARSHARGSGGVSTFAVDSPGAPFDDERERVRAAAAPGGRAMVTWTTSAAIIGAQVRGGAAVATASRFAPATTIGSPVRDVDALLPWLRSGGAAAVWADNSTVYGILPTGRGRLHVSTMDRPAASPPAPAVALTARSQALYGDEPVVVTARCAAACDLRAAIAGRGERLPDGTRAGSAGATGGRSGPGAVRLRLTPTGSGHIAPKAGGTVRVVVRAAAPGGSAVKRTALRVHVRRRTPPPFQRPLDVRARRAGDDVVVTWRTAGPARRVSYVVFGSPTRRIRPRGGNLPPSAWRDGRGERRFRVRLRAAPRARWAILLAAAKDRPRRHARIVVPVR